MDDDKSELVRRLFVVATEFVESAHYASTEGQSGRQSALEYADAARKLHAAARDIAALAEAATVIATHSAGVADHTPRETPSIQR